MALSSLQVFGFILGVISWVGMIGTCAAPEWRKNSQGETLIDNTLKFDGLWLRCRGFATGQTHCDRFGFFVQLPSVLQTCRALMISSIVLGFFAIIVTVFGLKCVTIGAVNHRTKSKTAIAGGVLFAASGMLTGAAVSFYAHNIVQEYYNPLLPKGYQLELRYEYGNALFVGWATLVLSIVSACIICASGFVMHRRRETPGPAHMHEFRPVSILQNVHQRNSIPMRTFENSAPQTQQRVSIHQSSSSNSTGNNRNGRYQNSYASSSGRRSNDRRWDARTSDSGRSRPRYNGRTVADVHKPRQNRNLKNASPPPKGVVLTVSGNKQEYL